MTLPDLPHGVQLQQLEMHADSRGSLTEVFRREWNAGMEPVQWNATHSATGVLRGVHVHLLHHDYVVLLHGRMSMGLKDLRTESPTSGMAAVLELSGERLQSVMIPPGVAHGFYLSEPSIYLYGVSHYWTMDDEL